MELADNYGKTTTEDRIMLEGTALVVGGGAP